MSVQSKTSQPTLCSFVLGDILVRLNGVSKTHPAKQKFSRSFPENDLLNPIDPCERPLQTRHRPAPTTIYNAMRSQFGTTTSEKECWNDCTITVSDPHSIHAYIAHTKESGTKKCISSTSILPSHNQIHPTS